MRVILSYLRFAGFAGTETYMFTVAQQMEQLGHDAMIYSPESGPITEFARRHGVRVVDAVADLPPVCDAVFAQDASTAYELAARYRTAVRVFVAHSAHHPIQSPPQLEHACHGVVVLNDRLRRRIEQLAWHPRIVRLRQPIDLRRFNLAPASGGPRPRVLALSNYFRGARAQIIERACSQAGADLAHVGVHARPAATSEHAIAAADIVVSLGRGTLEAMAAGRGAYVLGTGGCDGWVTPQTYAQFERDGFSGRATGAPVDAERLAGDLAGWREGMGEPTRDLVWAHHDAERHALDLLELVNRLDVCEPSSAGDLDEHARLARLEWDSHARAARAVQEAHQVRQEADRVRASCEELRDEARKAHEYVRKVNARCDELEQIDMARQAELRAATERAERIDAALQEVRAQLAELLATRRYRAATAVARPVDWIRSLSAR